MTLFRRHNISTFFMVIYFVWWALLLYWFLAYSNQYHNQCNHLGGGIFALSFLMVITYSLVLLVKALRAKTQQRADYLKFLALVITPALLITLLIYTGT